MPTTSFRQRGADIPGGLLGMLVLLASVETHVARHDLDYTRTDFWDWRQAGKYAQSDARTCQVLCFGTSRIQQAIVPKVVEHQSGLKTWNLGVCWGQAPAAYFLLKRALDAGAKPTSILVEYHPTALSEGPWGAKGYWPELLGFTEALDLGWSERDATLLGSTVLAHYLPSIKDRSQLQTMILAALAGRSGTMWSSTLTTLRNRNINRGAMVMPDAEVFQGKVDGRYKAAFFSKPWTCDPLNEVYIRRFLRLASERNISVYWMLPPFASELQEKREQSNNVAPYTAFVRRWMAEFPGLSVLDAERSNFASGAFYDASHLNRQGAFALSAMVGKQLRAQPAHTRKDRWIILPKFQVQPPNHEIEDMLMSANHLLNLGKIRR